MVVRVESHSRSPLHPGSEATGFDCPVVIVPARTNLGMPSWVRSIVTLLSTCAQSRANPARAVNLFQHYALVRAPDGVPNLGEDHPCHRLGTPPCQQAGIGVLSGSLE